MRNTSNNCGALSIRLEVSIEIACVIGFLNQKELCTPGLRMAACCIIELITRDLHLLCMQENEGTVRNARARGDGTIIRFCIRGEGRILVLNDEGMLLLVANMLAFNIHNFVKFDGVVFFI